MMLDENAFDIEKLRISCIIKIFKIKLVSKTLSVGTQSRSTNTNMKIIFQINMMLMPVTK